MSYRPRLRTKYKEEVAPALQTKFQYSSPMQVPRMTKICINQGLGAATADKKMIETAVQEMSAITGQLCVQTISKKDISN